MTLHSMDICPCILWLEEYKILGSQEFYNGADTKHEICQQCMLHIEGHGEWCEDLYHNCNVANSKRTTPIRNTLYCPMLGTGLSCGEIEFEVCIDCPDREE